MDNFKAKEIWLLDATIHYPQIMDVVKNYYKSWLGEHVHDANKPLFHYTTLDGLDGILSDRALWFGHATSLNDPNELQYGKKLIEHVIQKLSENESSEYVRAFLHGLSVNVSAFDTQLYHVFVACFCDSENILSQWRAYANRGGGYSLGLTVSNETSFESIPADALKQPYIVLRKVIYEQQKQVALIREYLSLVIDALKSMLSAHNYEGRDAVDAASIASSDASNILFDFMLCFKNPAFEEESEWRLIRCTRDDHDAQNVHFRASAEGLIPYRPIALFYTKKDGKKYFPLASLRFGPTLEPVRTAASLRLFLAKQVASEHSISLPEYTNIQSAGYDLR